MYVALNIFDPVFIKPTACDFFLLIEANPPPHCLKKDLCKKSSNLKDIDT